MGKNKRYQTNVPVDGRNKPVTYEISGSGEITIEKVGSESGSDLSPAEKAKIVKAIKDAPHPGNELPEGSGGPVDPGYGKPEGGRPDNTLPGGGARPDQGLPGGQGGRPDNTLPGGQPRPDQDLPQQGANPNLNPDLDPDLKAGGRPDQSLPGSGKPDQELPETPEPKE
jgi:hypothetical protein